MKCFDVLKSHLAPLFAIFFYLLAVADSASVYYTNYYNNGYEVRDLIKTDTCFTAYANMWGYSAIQSTYPYIYCSDGYYILGGLNVLGPPSSSVQTGAYWSRTYASLPSHNVIFFSLTLYLQSSWDSNDYVQIQFGGTTINALIGVVSSRYYESTYCPTGQVVIRNIRIFGSVQHTSTTLNLYVISQANENNANEAFGIREFNTMYIQAATPPADTVCNTGPDGVTTSLQCTCSEGYYYSGGSCLACDSNCASCYAAGATSCYQCKPGSSLIGMSCVTCYAGCNFCTGTGYNECIECARDFFLLNGNQCVSKCDPPLVQGTDANGCVNTCSTPCTTVTDFVYWDGACNATCPDPLVTSNLDGVINYCRWPCADGQFLLWNGVCVNTCPKPFIPVAQNGQQFCTTPCTTGEWLYWDESCGTECNFPLNQNTYNGQMLCEYLCPSNTYLYWNGTCISTCPPALQNRTFKGYEFCDFPLDDTRLYLYWDGTSEDTCNLPLLAQAQGSPMIRYFCYYPCQPSQYLYVNGTCASFCYYPLSVRNQNGWLFCDNPCPDPVNDFLWWNGTCRTDCNSPYLQRIEPGTKYCDFPCVASQYLYWDDTCMPTCAGPLQNYTASLEPMQFCNYTCLVTEYSYWNNTCGTSCDFPLVGQTYKSRLFCEYPCGRSQYLFYNGTCSDNCLSPYVHRRENGYGYCEYPCDDSEYLFWDGQCLADCDSPLIYQAGSYGEKFCFTPCMNPLEYYIAETGQCVESCDEDSRVQSDLYLRCLWPPVPEDNGLIGLLLVIQGYSGSTSLLAPVKLSQHIRYLDVNQPPRLKKFSLSEARSILTPKFGIPKPSDLETWFVSVSIPDLYDGQALYSSFFMNYWDAMTTIFSVLFVGLFLAAISYMVKADDNMVNYAIMDKLKTVFVWNFCLVLFVLNIDEALLYISIDFRSAKLNNGSATFSIFMCLLWILLVVIFVLTSHYVLKKRHRIKKQALESEEFEGGLRRWEGWQVVFKGFRDNTHFNRYFYLLYIIRVAFPVFVSVLFLYWPITQTTLHVVTSVFIVCYIILANPLKRAVNYIQLLLLETLILVVNISAFLMAVFDRMDTVGDRAYVLLGDIIIMANFFYNVIVIVFLPIKLALEAYNLYKFELSQEKKNPSNWVRLLVVPVQQCAFGFEEVLPQVYNPYEEREHDSGIQSEVITENINNFKRPISEDQRFDEVMNFDKPTLGKRPRRLKAYGMLRSSQPIAIAEEDETDSIPKRSPRMPSMFENSFSPMIRQSERSFDQQMTPAGQSLVSPLDMSRAMFLEKGHHDDELVRDSVILRGFDTYGEEYPSPRIGERGYSPERNQGVKGSVMVSHAPNTPTYAQRKPPNNLFSNRQRRSNAAMRGGSIPSLAHGIQDDYKMDKAVNDDW